MQTLHKETLKALRKNHAQLEKHWNLLTKPQIARKKMAAENGSLESYISTECECSRQIHEQKLELKRKLKFQEMLINDLTTAKETQSKLIAQITALNEKHKCVLDEALEEIYLKNIEKTRVEQNLAIVNDKLEQDSITVLELEKSHLESQLEEMRQTLKDQNNQHQEVLVISEKQISDLKQQMLDLKETNALILYKHEENRIREEISREESVQQKLQVQEEEHKKDVLELKAKLGEFKLSFLELEQRNEKLKAQNMIDNEEKKRLEKSFRESLRKQNELHEKALLKSEEQLKNLKQQLLDLEKCNAILSAQQPFENEQKTETSQEESLRQQLKDQQDQHLIVLIKKDEELYELKRSYQKSLKKQNDEHTKVLLETEQQLKQQFQKAQKLPVTVENNCQSQCQAREKLAVAEQHIVKLNRQYNELHQELLLEKDRRAFQEMESKCQKESSQLQSMRERIVEQQDEHAKALVGSKQQISELTQSLELKNEELTKVQSLLESEEKKFQDQKSSHEELLATLETQLSELKEELQQRDDQLKTLQDRIEAEANIHPEPSRHKPKNFNGALEMQISELKHELRHLRYAKNLWQPEGNSQKHIEDQLKLANSEKQLDEVKKDLEQRDEQLKSSHKLLEKEEKLCKVLELQIKEMELKYQASEKAYKTQLDQTIERMESTAIKLGELQAELSNAKRELDQVRLEKAEQAFK